MMHVHAMDIRPDVIIRSGTIQPYAIRDIPPTDVARHSVAAFEDLASGGAARVAAEIQPEEFVARARTVAVALAQGKKMPEGSDARLMAAAQMIRDGVPFTVRSAGRMARVLGREPAPKATPAPAMNGFGQTVRTIAPPTSWLGLRRRWSQTSSAGRPRWTSKGWVY